MNSVHVPNTEPSAMNGIPSTTNGVASTHSANHSHFQSGSSDKTQSISAGMCHYTPFTAFEYSPLNLCALDEIALYDRQIRLWGVRAQER